MINLMIFWKSGPWIFRHYWRPDKCRKTIFFTFGKCKILKIGVDTIVPECHFMCVKSLIGFLCKLLCRYWPAFLQLFENTQEQSNFLVKVWKRILWDQGVETPSLWSGSLLHNFESIITKQYFIVLAYLVIM